MPDWCADVPFSSGELWASPSPPPLPPIAPPSPPAPVEQECYDILRSDLLPDASFKTGSRRLRTPHMKTRCIQCKE